MLRYLFRPPGFQANSPSPPKRLYYAFTHIHVANESLVSEKGHDAYENEIMYVDESFTASDISHGCYGPIHQLFGSNVHPYTHDGFT